MATSIHIPTALTFSDLREGISTEALTVINAWQAQKSQPSVAIGDPNPFVMLINDFDMGGSPWERGSTPESMAVCGGIKQVQYMPSAYLNLIVGVGGEVYGYPMWFEIDDVTRPVPSYIPGHQDEEGDTLTFLDWNPGQPIEQHGNKYYKRTAVDPKGELLPASILVQAIADSASWLSMKTREEYLTIVEDNSPSPA